MRFQFIGNKADVAFVSVKNNGATTIPAGAPVFYQMNGTDDGLAVVNANSAGAAGQNLFAGIATKALTQGKVAEAQVWGVAQSVRLSTGTRAATTDAFATAAAIAVGDIMQIVTVSGVDGIVRNAAGATNTVFPHMVAAQTLASADSVASATSLTNLTRGYTTLKVFVRAM